MLCVAIEDSRIRDGHGHDHDCALQGLNSGQAGSMSKLPVWSSDSAQKGPALDFM